jgi:hypothetical protein
MTWGAFLSAMRNGIQARVGGAAARRAPQQVTSKTGARAASTQSINAKEEKKSDFWENMYLDVSEGIYCLFHREECT